MKRAFRKPDSGDVQAAYQDALKPLNANTGEVPARKPEPIKEQRCRVEGQSSALRKGKWKGVIQRARVEQFKSARNVELTKALLAHRLSKAETTRERRKLRDCVDVWARSDQEQLHDGFSGGPSSGVRNWIDLDKTSTFDVNRLLDAWQRFFPGWFEGEFLYIAETLTAEMKKDRPQRGRTVRVNGERQWKRRRGRPRTSLRPTRYRPRRATRAPNFAADASTSQAIE